MLRVDLTGCACMYVYGKTYIIIYTTRIFPTILSQLIMPVIYMYTIPFHERKLAKQELDIL